MTKKIAVEFVSVGAQHKTWTAQLRDLTDGTLTREVHKAHAIMSRYPEFDWSDDGTEALIYAGIRAVGRLRVLNGAYTAVAL